MSDASHANFYVVSATVIPVLFLAFALQTSYTGRLRKAAESAHEALDRSNPWEAHAYRRSMVVILLAAIGRFTLVFGILGEALSLWALMEDQDATYTRNVIFWIIIVVLVEVVAGTAFVSFFSPEILLFRIVLKTIFGEAPTKTAEDSRDLKTERNKKEAQAKDGQP